jgi:hypothetical protein
MDIGLGPAGSERVAIADLDMGNVASKVMRIPLDVPKGERISVRGQTGYTSAANFSFAVFWLIPWFLYDEVGCQVWDTFGANLATSEGLNLLGAGGTYAYGPWTEVTPASPRNYRLAFMSLGAPPDSTMPASSFQVQLGVGSAGQEQIIAESPRARTNGSEQLFTAPHYPFHVRIKAGERLSMRSFHVATSFVNPLNPQATLHLGA